MLPIQQALFILQNNWNNFSNDLECHSCWWESNIYLEHNWTFCMKCLDSQIINVAQQTKPARYFVLHKMKQKRKSLRFAITGDLTQARQRGRPSRAKSGQAQQQLGLVWVGLILAGSKLIPTLPRLSRLLFALIPAHFFLVKIIQIMTQKCNLTNIFLRFNHFNSECCIYL